MDLRRDSRANPALGDPALPARFAECTVKALPPGPLVSVLHEYMGKFWEYAGQGKAPLLIGTAQQWKTYAAAVIVRSIHFQFRLRTMFVCCLADISKLERDRFSEDTREYVQRMTRIPFLVMDDFSDMRTGTFGSDIIVEVASARHHEQLPTLWTGNILAKDIGLTYGPGFARRIEEGSAGLTVQF